MSRRSRVEGYRCNPSRTRSKSLKGRPSPKKGVKKQIPRAQMVVGLVKRQREPAAKDWPADCFVIVVHTPATINVANIRGKIIDAACSDCGTRLALDSHKLSLAIDNPYRDRRPLKYVCISCFGTYDQHSTGVQTDAISH